MGLRPKRRGTSLSAIAVTVLIATTFLSVPGAHAVVPALAVSQALGKADAEGEALAEAAATDERVEVGAYTSETTQVFAEPEGGLTLESTAVPQRVRRGDAWADVDLSLHAAADGTLRPAASVADVRFSGGGTGAMAAVVNDGRKLTLSWPGRLPEPTVSGPSATYPNVFPEVDLVVSATDTGFSHVLVVRSPAAAADPRVRELRFGLGGDADVVAHAGGGLQAFAGGTELAIAEPAAMWDSTPPPAAARVAVGAATMEASPAEPGEASNTAPVAATVEGDDLVLRPDASLLGAPAAAFPLYIDPSWSTGKKRWAYATDNNTNNTDTSVARVGKDPEGSRKYRSFFEFSTSFLNSRYIRSAYVQMELEHSASCDETWTHMYATGSIASAPRTKWSPKLTTWLAATASAAPKGDGCDNANDQVVNFRDNGDKPITKKIAAIAKVGTATVTIGFCACNSAGEYETSWDRWKKFYPNKAKLIVEYASYPGKPVNLSIGGAKCSSGTVSTGDATPALYADYPDADNQTLTASYEWVEVPASGGITDATPRKTAPGSKSVIAGTGVSSPALAGALKGHRYAIRAHATDPSPYNISGVWSSWCQFTVDTDVPAPPVIGVVTAPTLPGTPATVTFTSANADAAKFWYGWTDMPLNSVAATGTTTKTATVTLTAARYGDLTLYAYVTDVTQNKGNEATRTFAIGRPGEAIARWPLESYPGAPLSDALNDTKPAVGGDTPLVWDPTLTDHDWLPDSRLLGGSTSAFDRTPGALGAALTAANVPIDTSKSFSAAVWARLEDDTTYHTVISKDGGQMSGFRIMYRSDNKSWCMTLRPHDAKSLSPILACAPAALTKVGKWTHLAGVYDDAELRLKLYVDGKLSANYLFPDTLKTDWAGGWNATGPIVVGRAKDSAFTDSRVDWFHGEIADVQIFDRALVDQDLVGARKDDDNHFDEPGLIKPVQVGRWDFGGASFCYAAGIPDTCNAPDSSSFDRRLTLTPGTEVGEGIVDNALVLDGTHWAGEGDPHYGEATREFGWTRHNTAGEGEPPVLADAAVLRTDEPFSVASWVRLDDTTTDQTVLSQDSAGAAYSGFDLRYRAADAKWVFSIRNTPTATDAAQQSIVAADADDPTVWHHLVAVFDPGFGLLRLYVDGEPAVPAALNTALTPWQATGPLVVGRSDQPGGDSAYLYGSLDNVTAWQGVLTDAMALQWYDAELPLPESGTE